MKKSFLIFGIVTATLVSCETKEGEKGESKEPVKTVEISKDSYLDFNDAIVLEIEKAQDILNVLKVKDSLDIPEAEMIQAAAEAKEKTKALKSNLQAIVPAGKGSEEYIEAAIDLIETTINLTQVYSDFAYSLGITEMEWNEEQITEWQNMAEPQFLDYLDAFKHLGLMQKNYAAFQNLEIEPLYEEEEIIEEEITENI